MNMLDWINMMSKRDSITREEFADAMRSGDTDTIENALERMEAMGGYECLG